MERYVEGLPEILERVIDLNSLGSFLVASVATEDVDSAFEDEGEAGGSRCFHGGHLPPFFLLINTKVTFLEAVLFAGRQ